MDILIIYNPKSGRAKSEEIIDKIKKTKFFENNKIETFELKNHNDHLIFDQCQNKTFDIVVAIGGDGTINTSANLILSKLPKAKLMIVPTGSSNTLAMSLNVPLSWRKKIKKLNNPAGLKDKIIDVGVVDEKNYFLESVMVGYAAQVAGTTKQPMKNRHGFRAYIFNFFRHPKPDIYKFKLFVDGKSYDIEASTLGVLNAFEGFAGIPTRQKTSNDDGMLDVMFMKYDNFLKFLVSVFYLFLTKASPKKQFKIFSGQKIVLSKNDNHQKIPLLIDGEPAVFENNHLTFKVIPRGLNILI